MIRLWFFVQVSDSRILVEIMLEIMVDGRVGLIRSQTKSVRVAPDSVMHPCTIIVKLLGPLKFYSHLRTLDVRRRNGDFDSVRKHHCSRVGTAHRREEIVCDRFAFGSLICCLQTLYTQFLELFSPIQTLYHTIGSCDMNIHEWLNGVWDDSDGLANESAVS